MGFVELFGYAASVLVAVSLMMSAIVKLRIINLIGATCFSTYGFLIGAYPVAFLNGFIALVDIYYLIEIFSAKEYLRVLRIKSNSEYLAYFLDYHKKDIKKFMPGFSFAPADNWDIEFILRNTVPAGLVCSEYIDPENIYIKLDYAIPGYRDFKTSKYVFDKIRSEGKIKRIYSDPGNKHHEKYLRKMGFVKTELNGKPVYLLSF